MHSINRATNTQPKKNEIAAKPSSAKNPTHIGDRFISTITCGDRSVMSCLNDAYQSRFGDGGGALSSREAIYILWS